MKKSFPAVMLLFLAGFFYSCSGKLPEPPAAEKIKKELTSHGHTRVDPYYWLQERENPKVLAHLKAEKEYADKVFKHTGMADLQEKLYHEIVGRIKPADQSVPYKLDGYYYYKRFEPGKEYPFHCRKKGSLQGEEEVLLDVNKMAAGHNYYHVKDFSISSGNNLIAFGVDTVSRRKYTLHFKNLVTGRLLEDKIPGTTGEAAWANDNKTVFYTAKAKNLRPFKIMKHRLGEPVEKDREVFRETDDTFYTSVLKTRSKKYVLICSFSTLSTEYRFLDADRPEGGFSIIHPREKDMQYWVKHFNGKFYIRTNWKAKNFRLMETPVGKTFKENWREVVPHRADVLLEQFEIFKDFLVLNERQDARLNLAVVKWADMSRHCLDFAEETYTASLAFNPEMDTGLLRFTYNSLTTPKSTFDYDMNGRTRKLLKREHVAGDFAPGNYRSERRYAVARDGVRVPISLVYRKGLEMKGDNPLLLEAYGAYGESFDPGFSFARPSLLDRGFVYAIAHIRGGQEMGRDWYDRGRMLHKKNSFRDFIDCAEYLVKEKFTDRGKLFAMGGSAGGLLMGAVTNMRPDLFQGVIAEVPWMDVVTCMLDDSIPLVTNEYDEWGNP
ncbi:MAG: S9 family peptidase, partial [bacterium]|nr:S9 family peptidase [bacterium]